MENARTRAIHRISRQLHTRHLDKAPRRMRYRSVAHTFLLLISLVCFGACAPDGDSATDSYRRGAKGIVEFRLPEGWTPVAGSMETRFKPGPGSGQGVQIQVTEIPIDKPRNLEKERDVWLNHQEETGSEVLKSEPWRQDGFAGVEYAHTRQNAMGKAISHAVNIQNDEVMVATNLVVSEDAYATYLPVYLEVVRSIRPVESAEAP